MIKDDGMCMIVDANVMGKFLREPENEDCDPIYRWLGNGGKILYSSGGQFKYEISASAKVKLSKLAAKGNAILVGAEKFHKIERDITTSNLCKSDDFHILALASFTGARVLYTKDRDLIKDFKNKSLIDNPRGRIYSSKSNAGLLNQSICGTQ